MTLPADMKLTDWIDGSIKPERDGVYQRRRESRMYVYTEYSAFRRGKWHMSGFDPWWAESYAADRCVSTVQDVKWRGLAEPPK